MSFCLLKKRCQILYVAGHGLMLTNISVNALTKGMGAGWKYYGLNRGEHEGKTGIWYREWAPGARVSCPYYSPCRLV